MGDLSEHFSKWEFADHGTGKTIVVPELIDGLEQFRALLGLPVRIHSGYRSVETNQLVGGARDSLHLLGKAADVSIDGLSAIELYALATLVPVFNDSGIGLYPAEEFIHVDVRGTVARWARLDGKYVSIQEALPRLLA